jgi:hypothetical protein
VQLDFGQLLATPAWWYAPVPLSSYYGFYLDADRLLHHDDTGPRMSGQGMHDGVTR